MAFEPSRALDDVDWRLVEELQDDARLSFSELGRRVSMSSPAVAERVRRLEETGVITGYHAVVDPSRLGLPVLSYVRVRGQPGLKRRTEEAMDGEAQVLECHHVTGDDCYVVKVAARSMQDLERVVEVLGGYGPTTTSIVFGTPVPRRTLRRGDLDAEHVA